MFEVEAKIRISKQEYDSLRKRFEIEGLRPEIKDAADVYYGKQGAVTIRLRNRGGESTFEIKRKEILSAIESNIEIQWKISDVKAWRRWLVRLSIRPYASKLKKSLHYKKNGFIIELNHVRLLGYTLEIERLVNVKREILKAKRELVRQFNDLGFKKERFEPKTYLELLANV